MRSLATMARRWSQRPTLSQAASRRFILGQRDGNHRRGETAHDDYWAYRQPVEFAGHDGCIRRGRQLGDCRKPRDRRLWAPARSPSRTAGPVINGTVTNGTPVPDLSVGFVGNLSGELGTVTVSGTWTNTGTLVVGGLGTGTLTIQDGGVVRSGGGGSMDWLPARRVR